MKPSQSHLGTMGDEFVLPVFDGCVSGHARVAIRKPRDCASDALRQTVMPMDGKCVVIAISSHHDTTGASRMSRPDIT